MSGNAIGPYNIPTKEPYELATKQGILLGINRTNSSDLIQELRKRDAADIINSVDGLKVGLTLYA